jgi:hypothetical protein
MAPEALTPAVTQLLAAVGRGKPEFQLQPLSASGNNRVFVLNTADEKLVLKWYFHDPADLRDRLGAEYAFLEHAWDTGLRCIPKPMGKDPVNHLALYEFVEGEKLQAQQVKDTDMEQAAQFLASLNTAHSRATADTLPPASEACFGVAAHLAMVDARLARFATLQPESEVDSVAATFVADLAKYWTLTKTRLYAGCKVIGLDPEADLPASQRCLSPSDFGFHNALVRPDGTLCFIDFEYAGWDDPAKAVGDFFSHPGVQVSRQYFDRFLATVLAPFAEPEAMAARVRLLEPVFQLKWCCIILNEFLPAGARRRTFANPGDDAEQRKQCQLLKAQTLYQSLAH